MGGAGSREEEMPSDSNILWIITGRFAAEATRARSVHASEQERRALRTGGLRLGLHKAVDQRGQDSSPLLKRTVDGRREAVTLHELQTYYHNTSAESPFIHRERGATLGSI